MKPALTDLNALLTLEAIEQNLFRAHHHHANGSGSVFGGQPLAQAIIAANHTVDNRVLHSLHAYFLRPGDLKQPIIYEVERIRDGASFTTRRVVAIQHGKPIFFMSAQFQITELGLHHQASMPDVPGPENLLSDLQIREQSVHLLPSHLHAAYLQKRAIEFRPLQKLEFIKPSVQAPLERSWLRAECELPDSLIMHQAALAYATDFGLLRTAMLPHGLSFLQPGVQAASLDHAMWFHQEFKINDWLLQEMESPFMGGSRGLCHGKIFSAQGKLVASVAQEGLVRVHGVEHA